MDGGCRMAARCVVSAGRARWAARSAGPRRAGRTVASPTHDETAALEELGPAPRPAARRSIGPLMPSRLASAASMPWSTAPRSASRHGARRARPRSMDSVHRRRDGNRCSRSTPRRILRGAPRGRELMATRSASNRAARIDREREAGTRAGPLRGIEGGGVRVWSGAMAKELGPTEFASTASRPASSKTAFAVRCRMPLRREYLKHCGLKRFGRIEEVASLVGVAGRREHARHRLRRWCSTEGCSMARAWMPRSEVLGAIAMASYAIHGAGHVSRGSRTISSGVHIASLLVGVGLLCRWPNAIVVGFLWSCFCRRCGSLISRRAASGFQRQC